MISQSPCWRLRNSALLAGERVTRLELATSSLARRCSTTELHPHFAREGIMSGMKRDARLLSGEREAPAGNFLESKPGPRRISLPKDTYENNDLNLPLLDRARLDCVRPIIADA